MGETAESKNPIFSKSGRRWIIAASALGLVALGTTTLYSLQTSQEKAADPQPKTPEVAPIRAVTALGRVEPQGEVITLAPPPNLGGSKVEELLVKEGDRLNAGQVIAILDIRDRYAAAVETAKQEVKVAQANLEIVKAGAKTGEINAQKATIARLKAELQGAIASDRAKIARLEAQLAGEEKAQAATIDRLEAELGNAQVDFQRYQQLAEDGAISSSDLDRYRLNSETARERLREANATYGKTVGMLREEIQETRATAQQTVDTLNKQIQEAIANLDRIAEIRPVDVQQAQAEVEKAIASLQQAQEDLELASVKAPFQGQVLEINTYPGESVDEDQGIAELGKTDQMVVVAEVYESDIGKVRLGQPVTVTSESQAFEGELKGKVSQIGLQIGKKDVLDTDPAADVDTRVVEVKILLDSEASKIVSGLTNSKVLVKIRLDLS
jgi:HlyD family secretion protein